MINSDDRMSAPALPALASLQLLKCKGIRDLTARAGSHIPLHTVILGPIIRGQPKTNLKVTFEQESKQIRYSKYHVKMK